MMNEEIETCSCKKDESICEKVRVMTDKLMEIRDASNILFFTVTGNSPKLQEFKEPDSFIENINLNNSLANEVSSILKTLRQLF